MSARTEFANWAGDLRKPRRPAATVVRREIMPGPNARRVEPCRCAYVFGSGVGYHFAISADCLHHGVVAYFGPHDSFGLAAPYRKAEGKS